MNRWSSRVFVSDEIPEAELLAILETAYWAPSSYNSQPWRFIYVRRGTPHWDSLLYLLNNFDRGWTGNAAALVIVLSKTTFALPGKSEELPAPPHSSNAGASWNYLAPQALVSEGKFKD